MHKAWGNGEKGDEGSDEKQSASSKNKSKSHGMMRVIRFAYKRYGLKAPLAFGAKQGARNLDDKNLLSEGFHSMEPVSPGTSEVTSDESDSN